MALRRIKRNVEIDINLDGVVELRTGTWKNLIRNVIGPGMAANINVPAVSAANLTKRIFHNLRIAHRENTKGITPKYGV